MLSDGTLAYLALVASLRLETNATLLAFDEPETHLHPELQARVMTLLESASVSVPVVVATHSDVLLDVLDSPEKAAVVLDVEEDRSSTLRRLDATSLQRWLKDYRGIGNLRAADYLPHVLGPRNDSDDAN